MADDVARLIDWNAPLRLFALIDGNSFYNSAETVHKPWLRNRPLVTCSNGDGCIIALNAQAKALGLKMGTPRFMVEKFMRFHNVIWFSSNYELYDVTSSRMHMHLSQYSQNYEVYSIDEGWGDITGEQEYRKLGRKVIDDTAARIRIPVCYGVGPSKSLSKVSNRLAKKDPSLRGLYAIDSEEVWLESIKKIEVGDIWGIGWKYEEQLKHIGVYTAYDFMRLPRKWVRKKMKLQGEKIWQELHGVVCYELEENPADKKNTGTSRAFGETVTQFHEVAVAATRYLESASRKVRKQGSVARKLFVALETDRFSKDKPQYTRTKEIELPTGMNTTLQLLPYLMQLLKEIFPAYKPGQPLFEFKRVKVMLGRLEPPVARQLDMFTDFSDFDKYVGLQEVIDQMNHNRKMDNRLIQYGPSIIKNDKTIVKRKKLSAHPTGRWSDRITIQPEPLETHKQSFPA